MGNPTNPSINHMEETVSVQDIISRLEKGDAELVEEVSEIQAIYNELAELKINHLSIEFLGDGNTVWVEYIDVNDDASKELYTRIRDWANEAVKEFNNGWNGIYGGEAIINLDVENRIYSYSLYENVIKQSLVNDGQVSID